MNKEFVEDFVFPTVKAGAVYEGDYLLGTSFARPVIAKRIVEIAKAEGADAICHVFFFHSVSTFLSGDFFPAFFSEKEPKPWRIEFLL